MGNSREHYLIASLALLKVSIELHRATSALKDDDAEQELITSLEQLDYATDSLLSSLVQQEAGERHVPTS